MILTNLYLRECNDYSVPFSQEVIQNMRILNLSKIIKSVEENKILEYQTIEGLEREDLLEPVFIHDFFDENIKQKVDFALNKALVESEKLANKLYADGFKDLDICGFAYAATYDTTNPIVQYMVLNELAYGPMDSGQVRVSLNQSRWPPMQSLNYYEAIYDVVSRVLTEELDVEFHRVSFLD